ncbi:DUF1419 domain-containing protein [Agrobacterium tumefaciens]|jgi:hypothetical protein|uniref:DUF1419 domain-containing protein n=1 Tax=Agrobacterium tumefaciens TaxID=358 RepID=A0AA44F9R3_AGRTU|nr:DUF1419 domain-containing protein [Agrobacterium tumefaciens]NSY09620.1 DUF1419 domain-containing protein [Agrobacterium tumefaciens]NSZ09326.1 DUF1419 domain-containing protein [Agrobacterium tumefaciens]NTB87938.1 DUF1419 domain-containing protein [Agrobacterium tumefaciens]NTC20056.1 DUF1419 domain-containing protein [Agrobacterium tumefaciens]NTC31185.1 DUF1419 domain-containing protein [Agrobacterium tumefaciens]
MSSISLHRKVFQGVAKRADMFRMFDRHARRPDRFDGDQSASYAGEWFEIDENSYTYMLDILPPLWMRGPIFAMREFMTGSVTSVFYAIRIDDAVRYFHTYCDLSDPNSVEAMRSAIIDRETRPVRSMSREERLEHIWSTTADDYRGYAGPRWPQPLQGHRTIMLYGGKEGSFLKLLDTLTDEEIAAKLPVHLRHLPTVLAA